MMEFYDVIDARRTVRHFTDAPVDRAVIEKILAAGLKAPSNDHLRQWDFLLLEGADKLQALRPVAAFVSGLGPEALDRWTPGTDQRAMYEKAMPRQYTMLASAPWVVLVFFKENPILWKPTAINSLNTLAGAWCCIENILLAAAAEGLGCAIRIPVGEEGPDLAKALGAPAGHTMACYLAIGHPDPADPLPRQVEARLEDKLHIGKW